MAKQFVKDFVNANRYYGAETLAEDINKFMQKNNLKIVSISYSTTYDSDNYSVLHSALCIFELEEGEVDELR